MIFCKDIDKNGIPIINLNSNIAWKAYYHYNPKKDSNIIIYDEKTKVYSVYMTCSYTFIYGICWPSTYFTSNTYHLNPDNNKNIHYFSYIPKVCNTYSSSEYDNVTTNQFSTFNFLDIMEKDVLYSIGSFDYLNIQIFTQDQQSLQFNIDNHVSYPLYDNISKNIVLTFVIDKYLSIDDSYMLTITNSNRIIYYTSPYNFKDIRNNYEYVDFIFSSDLNFKKCYASLITVDIQENYNITTDNMKCSYSVPSNSNTLYKFCLDSIKQFSLRKNIVNKISFKTDLYYSSKFPVTLINKYNTIRNIMKNINLKNYFIKNIISNIPSSYYYTKRDIHNNIFNINNTKLNIIFGFNNKPLLYNNTKRKILLKYFGEKFGLHIDTKRILSKQMSFNNNFIIRSIVNNINIILYTIKINNLSIILKIDTERNITSYNKIPYIFVFNPNYRLKKKE